MVAMNSIPQHEVANGKGHNECDLARPTTLSNRVAKKPAPSIPSGAETILISLIKMLKNKTHILTEDVRQMYNKYYFLRI